MKHTKTTTQRTWQLIALAMLFLIVNLPIVSALEISNVRAEDITQTSAVIKWDTDEQSNSFIEYGQDPQDFARKGDARQVTEHEIAISGLDAQTTYQYQVESAGQVENKGGSLYSFQTLAPDLLAPELTLDVPNIVQGTRITVNGTTEVGAFVQVLVNGNRAGSTTAKEQNGTTIVPFSIDNVQVPTGQSTLTVTATDEAGNMANESVNITSDSSIPTISSTKPQGILEDRSFTYNASFSESVSIDITVNDRSVHTGEGTSISQEIPLEEGENQVIVTITDAAGHSSVEQFNVNVDTTVPTVDATIKRGNEYYEGSEESTIEGTTEAGASVYLYVYRPQAYEWSPDFEKAVAKTTADQNGSFSFNDVSFARSILDYSIGDLKPRSVPSDLLSIQQFPIDRLKDQDPKTYYIYIIAEDASGKSGYWQETVSVNRCFAGDIAFGINSATQFQQPRRLIPSLLEQGRQEIQTVFSLEYLGQGAPTFSASGQQVEAGYRVVNKPRVEPACTQEMINGDEFRSIACKIIAGGSPTILKSNDESSFYVQWQLMSTEEFQDREDEFWDDIKKRELVFPLKIEVDYQEKVGVGENGDEWSEQKTQTFCYDLGYAVDIPLDSKEYIPDWLAEEGITTLNTTINYIQTAREYVEIAYYVTAISCMASFLLRWIARAVRQATSSLEYYFDTFKPQQAAKKSGEEFKGDEKCPSIKEQNNLYQRDTLENWYKLIHSDPNKYLGGMPSNVQNAYKADQSEKLGAEGEKLLLDERCPKTSNAWQLESALDSAYKWTCDRAFCRAVPAGWTESKSEDEIEAVIAAQNQCAVTARGVPLKPVENCQEKVRANPTQVPNGWANRVDEISQCWQTTDGTVYVQDLTRSQKETYLDARSGYVELTPVFNYFSGTLQNKEPLRAYQAPGSENLIVGKSLSCAEVCEDPRKPGWEKASVIEGTPGISIDKYGCAYEEYDVELGYNTIPAIGKDTDYLAAGYTKECFVEPNLGSEPKFKQCICQKTDALKKIEEQGKSVNGAHVAFPGETPEGKDGEEWFYRQERIAKDTKNTQGTIYSNIRYYSGRDFSGAFGQDYVTDYFRGDNKQVPEVDPHDGFVETVQTVCTSGILKNLVMLESILTGLRNCLVEAKYTGFHDAGMCKTWFSQQVCGLVYKGVASMVENSCVPNNFDSAGEGAFGDIGVVLSEGSKAMTTSLDSSISDLKDDYGNAQLNEYFSGGAQGFAQSMCMAAFGFDFPLFSEEFLLDAAYAFPMHSNVLISPAYRELSSLDPVKQTAIYNYEVGAAIFPGCRIRNYKVSLKCIGPEDRNKEGVDPTCVGQGCDCLDAGGTGNFAGEKEFVLDQGSNLKSGSMFSVPIESPVRANTHYRYDHVKVELDLDPSENEEFCIDEPYRNAKKAEYYYPVTDVTGPNAGCEVDTLSGQYKCSALAKLFGFGGSYLQQPYLQCYDKRSDRWTSCNTPNLFLLGDEIKVKVNMQLDGDALCLKRTVRNVPGVQDEYMISIPEGVSGTFGKEETISIVQDAMFGGKADILTLQGAQSNMGCSTPTYTQIASKVQDGQTYVFGFEQVAANTFRVKLPGAVRILTPGVTNEGGYLSMRGQTQLTLNQINEIEFDVGGFRTSRVLGNVNPAENPKQCVYKIGARSGFSTDNNVNHINVEYELLQRDEGGGCTLPKEQVPTNAGGKAIHKEAIRIQLKESAFANIGGMHDLFMQGNYDQTKTVALEILQDYELSDSEQNMLAIYYSTAAWIMKGQREGDAKKYSDAVSNLLNYFFNRQWAGFEQPAKSYPTLVTSTNDYQKIYAYLSEVRKQFGVSASGAGTKPVTSSVCPPEFDKDIGERWLYQCLPGGKFKSCPKDGASKGVASTQTFDLNAAPVALQQACTNPASSPATGSNDQCADYTISIPGDSTYKYRCDSRSGWASGCAIIGGQKKGNSFEISTLTNEQQKQELERQCSSAAGSSVCADYTLSIPGDSTYKYKCVSSTRAAGCGVVNGQVKGNEFPIPSGHYLERECNK